MKIKEHHLNSMGTVHGAALFALADLVFAVASIRTGLSPWLLMHIFLILKQ